MKSIKLAAALATTLALTLITGSVFAQEPATPNVEKRQDRQQKRIAKGVESGALTDRG
jgi:hypothetical protein